METALRPEPDAGNSGALKAKEKLVAIDVDED